MQHKGLLSDNKEEIWRGWSGHTSGNNLQSVIELVTSGQASLRHYASAGKRQKLPLGNDFKASPFFVWVQEQLTKWQQ